MSARFITSVLIVAAAITSFAAAPVRADSDDVKRILRGVAGLYIAGRVIQEIERSGGRVYTHGHQRQRYYQDRRRSHSKRSYAPRRHALPRRCLIRVDRRHTTFALGGRCMQRYYPAVHRLPRGCEMRLGGRNSHRWGYSVRCLRSQGFEIAGRR